MQKRESRDGEPSRTRERHGIEGSHRSPPVDAVLAAVQAGRTREAPEDARSGTARVVLGERAGARCRGDRACDGARRGARGPATGTAIGGFQFRLAPVVIVWTLDWRRVEEQGRRLHELVDAGAVGVSPEKSHAYLDSTLIPFFQAATESIRQSGLTELDCGQGIAQATLIAFEEGLGTCLLGCPNDRKLRRALGLPDAVRVLVLQTVGYPAEDPEAGGQRPRLPFEARFALNHWGTPCPRDPAVVDELRQAKMLGREAPLAYRRAELQWLQEVYGLSDVFGDEAPAVVADLMAAAAEERRS